MSVALAFLHHICAFVIVAVLTVELILMRGELTATAARSILRMDAAYGIAALVLVAVGFGRVLYTEKGPVYYFHSAPFLIKMFLFALVGVLSIYPTIQFVSWRLGLRQDRAPLLVDRKRRTIRLLIHVELTLLFGIMLCAALMARGIGTFG